MNLKHLLLGAVAGLALASSAQAGQITWTEE